MIKLGILAIVVGLWNLTQGFLAEQDTTPRQVINIATGLGALFFGVIWFFRGGIGG